MWGMNGSYGWGGMGIGMLLFWGVLIFIVIALVRSGSRSCSSRGKTKTALDILEERYAKGEISKSDFDRMKQDIS